MLAIGKGFTENRQAIRFRIAVACPLVRDIGGCRGAIEQQRFLAVITRFDLKNGAGKPQPAGRVVRRDRDKLTEHQHAPAEVVLLKRGICIPA